MAARVDSACALLVVWTCGCYHLIEPVRPDPLDTALPAFPPGLAVRLECGHEEPVLVPLRSEGIHHLEVDLRDWSARLATECGLELSRRGVSVMIPRSSLDGTAVAGEPLPWLENAPPEHRAVLLVRVQAIEPPADGRGPLIVAELTGDGGAFVERHTSGDEARTFREALLELKRRIIDDPRLREWLMEHAALPSRRG